MSIFYVDIYNGNDANDGTSWANAWKTLLNGATPARIAPGDEIRISKTPDPVSIGNVTWPQVGKLLTLASARTQFIFSGDAAWTVSSNVNASTRSTSSSNYKYGSGSYLVYPAAAFATGKIAYYNLGASMDLSAFQELTFWLKPSTTINANVLKVCLCSDTSGDTIIDTFYIPLQYGTNIRPLTIPKSGGGNLGSSIQSIAIYADSDPGIPQLYFNCFTASKTNDINFSTLISKNGNAQGGIEGYYPIAYIDGTTVCLDGPVTQPVSGIKGYCYLQQETVETFIRQCFHTVQASTSTAQGDFFINDSGSPGAFISFVGGYEIGTTNCNGETFLNGTNGWGTGIYCAGAKSYLNISKISCARYNYGYNISGNCFTLDISNCVGNSTYGVYLNGSNHILSGKNLNNNGANGIYFSNVCESVIEYLSCFNNQTTSNGQIYLDACFKNHFKNLVSDNNNIMLQFQSSGDNRLKITEAEYTKTGWGIYISGWGGENYLYDSSIYLTSNYLFGKLNNSLTQNAGRITCKNLTYTIDGSLNYIAFIWTAYANGVLQSTTVHDTEPFAWALQIGSSINSSLPFDFPIAKVAFNANKQVTVKAWLILSNTFGKARLLVKDAPEYSLSEAYVETSSVSWTELTLTFTPSVSGVAELVIRCLQETVITFNAYIGSISITQAD